MMCKSPLCTSLGWGRPGQQKNRRGQPPGKEGWGGGEHLLPVGSGEAGEVFFLRSAKEGAFLSLLLPPTSDNRYGFKSVGSPGSLHTAIHLQGL